MNKPLKQDNFEFMAMPRDRELGILPASSNLVYWKVSQKIWNVTFKRFIRERLREQNK